MNEYEGRLSPIKFNTYKPLSEIVSDAIREAIRTGALAPRERLMEIHLANRLGVSRTPIREAIRRLEQEGFVVMIPRRGAYVADMSMKDISQVFEVRTALEELAAGLAAQRISKEEVEALYGVLAKAKKCMDNNEWDNLVELDGEFHEILYKASRNTRLLEISMNLHDQVRRFRSFLVEQPGRAETTWAEHRQVVDALAAHNATKAKEALVQHLHSAEKVFLRSMQQPNKRF